MMMRNAKRKPMSEKSFERSEFREAIADRLSFQVFSPRVSLCDQVTRKKKLNSKNMSSEPSTKKRKIEEDDEMEESDDGFSSMVSEGFLHSGR